jgi:hypothetical protein
MIGQRVAARAFAAGSIVLAGACTDASERLGPADQSHEPELPTRTQQPSLDNPIALARGVPGFGGFFLDRAGRPTVYLTDPAQRGAAAAALAPFLRARGLDPARLEVARGNYEYARLQRWFGAASPAALSIPGAVFADLDEAGNRLRIGVANAAAAAQVRRAATSLGIPTNAVVVQTVQPIRNAATLRGKVRPILGGLQLNFSILACSIGFSALTPAGQKSFITASHCTLIQGGTEATQYFQPFFLTAYITIGKEVADPVYVGGGACPAGRVCRYSDAARASYSSSTTFTLGGIGRTTGANTGSITLAATPLKISEESTTDQFPIGEVAGKVGRTTGWTTGPVSATCADVNVDGTNITQLCQTLVDGKVGAGDSGSPVFFEKPDGTVKLAGILWGGNTEGTLFAFSPLANIERPGELGPLTTF